MSVSPPSPFCKINDDILLYIFTINADLFSDGQALNRTRTTSQVCHQWRSLMLGTSFLWARLVDMDTIYCEPDHQFGDEVIRRSGTAPLWIRANSSGIFRDPPLKSVSRIGSFEKFFFGVVCENWQRIQKLVIHGWSSYLILNRSILSFPAPLLEEFEGELPGKPESVDSFDEESPMPLFSNQAPMLRRFCLREHVIDPEQASWIGYLHYIELDHSYGSANALAVLSATYNLQELRIGDVYTENLSTLPVVSLPHLKLLHYDSNPYPLDSGALLLDHVKVPLECVISIQISYISNYGESEDIRQELRSVVNSCVDNVEPHLQSHRLDIIYLNYSGSHVTGVSLARETAVPVDCLLAISIPQRGDYDSSQFRMLTNQIAQWDIWNITKVHLRAKGTVNPNWGPFFSYFSSFDTLSIDRTLRDSLSDIQAWLDVVTTRLEKTEVISSHLNFVEFAISKNYDVPTEDLSIVALNYAMPRLRCGHPISILDMSVHLPLENPSDLDSFTEVKGLTDVTLMCKSADIEGVFEYSCGSDCPENRVDL